jgi:hypothetical protein
MTVRLLVCTATLFTSLIVTGCGSSMHFTSGNAAQGAAPPSVAAVATQLNGVAPNRKQEVQFSEAMDPATINAKSFQVADSSGSPLPGSVTYDPDFETASFLPNPALQAGVSYTATITTAAASADGAHLAKAYSYSFTTRATTDTSPLAVLSVSPAANASCVSATALMIVTFDETPDASTAIPGNFMVTGPGGAIPVKLSTNVTTTQVVLTPASPLPSGTITVTVNNVADLAEVKMAAPYTWSFSTVCSGSGGGSGGNGNGATTQYQAPLFSDAVGGLDNAMDGNITVDATGNVTVHLTGATAGTTYAVQFCPAFDESSSKTPLDCIDLTTITTDTGGSQTTTVKFPQPGNWAGDFYLNDSAGKAAFQTFVSPLVNNQTYMATLVPLTTTNNGTDTDASPQTPGSGTVTLSNGSLQFTLSGALPSTNYFTNESETIFIDSSGTYELNTFTTDAKGDGTTTTALSPGPGGDLFQVGPQTTSNQLEGAGFIGGFSVPR